MRHRHKRKWRAGPPSDPATALLTRGVIPPAGGVPFSAECCRSYVKVVVVVNGAPADADSVTRRELESLGGIAMRLQRLIPQRPAAVIVLVRGGEAFSRQITREVLRMVSSATPVPPADDAQRQPPMLRAAALGPVEDAGAHGTSPTIQ